MKTHHLKTWPEQFRAIADGDKKAELRFNDRDFQVGDELYLEEWSPDTGAYTDGVVQAWITHILAGPGFGLSEGYVMLSIEQELPF